MKYILIITFNFIASVLLYAFIGLLEKEEKKIETINQKHNKEIQRVQQISKINPLLKESIRPIIEIKIQNLDEATLNLVRFYDNYAMNYNLVISRYFISDPLSQNIEFSYKIKTHSIINIEDLLNLTYDNGFFQFLEFKVNKTAIEGKMQLIQLYSSQNGDNNATASKQ